MQKREIYLQVVEKGGCLVRVHFDRFPVGYREFLRVFKVALIWLFSGLICWNKVWFNKGDTWGEMAVKGRFGVFVFFGFCGFILKYA